MALAVPTTQQAPEATNAKGNAVQANPFTKASRRKTETFLDMTSALGAGGTTLPQIDVPATGFLRHLVLTVEVDPPAGATALEDDAPWNVLENVTLKDVNGQPLHTISGYELFLANLFGGYVQRADPRKLPGYKATHGGGISFQLRVPVEIISRGALGALANTNSSMTYKLVIALAPRADVFTGATASPTVRIRGVVESWSNPAAADLRGVPNITTPPALGVTQNWSAQTLPITVGNNTHRLARVGNAIRNLIFVRRDAAGKRVDAWPDELGLYFDGSQWHKAPVTYFKARTLELFGYAPADVPAGVLVFPYTDDFDGTPGEEVGDFWIQTSGATRFELHGAYAAAGALTVLTNDVLAIAGAGGAGATLGTQA